jgi:hypothetical protein
MGLDMFLTKKSYIGAEFEHREVKAEVKITIGGKPVMIDVNKISEITERVGYWRKANQIHEWFVTNVQGGVDECQESYVTLDQLQSLKTECEQVLEFKDKASEILPRSGGFFFGGENYDEWYFSDIKDTIKILSDILEDKSESGAEISYYYQASW